MCVCGFRVESRSLGLRDGGYSRDFNIARFYNGLACRAIFRGCGQGPTARFDLDMFLSDRFLFKRKRSNSNRRTRSAIRPKAYFQIGDLTVVVPNSFLIAERHNVPPPEVEEVEVSLTTNQLTTHQSPHPVFLRLSSRDSVSRVSRSIP